MKNNLSQKIVLPIITAAAIGGWIIDNSNVINTFPETKNLCELSSENKALELNICIDYYTNNFKKRFKNIVLEKYWTPVKSDSINTDYIIIKQWLDNNTEITWTFDNEDNKKDFIDSFNENNQLVWKQILSSTKIEKNKEWNNVWSIILSIRWYTDTVLEWTDAYCWKSIDIWRNYYDNYTEYNKALHDIDKTIIGLPVNVKTDLSSFSFIKNSSYIENTSSNMEAFSVNPISYSNWRDEKCNSKRLEEEIKNNKIDIEISKMSI